MDDRPGIHRDRLDQWPDDRARHVGTIAHGEDRQAMCPQVSRGLAEPNHVRMRRGRPRSELRAPSIRRGRPTREPRCCRSSRLSPTRAAGSIGMTSRLASGSSSRISSVLGLAPHQPSAELVGKGPPPAPRSGRGDVNPAGEQLAHRRAKATADTASANSDCGDPSPRRVDDPRRGQPLADHVNEQRARTHLATPAAPRRSAQAATARAQGGARRRRST